ncbi:MAG: hypothetical protein GY742_15820 [Hyphomicrobiales bacterium]|nr:hypothetical protein [Hyphomicrobiales bacterium]
MTVIQTAPPHDGAGKLIILNEMQLMNSGFYRDTYVHPDDHELVLKIPRRNIEPTRKGLFGLGLNEAKDPNELEYEMWETLVTGGHDKSEYFCRVLGWSETNIGRALCVERLISDSGSPPTILGSLKPEHVAELNSATRRLILSCLNEFYEYVIQNAIHSCAWRLENISICRQNGKLVLKSFDTKATTVREWLPLSKYIKFARRRKIKRRTDKLFQYMQDLLSTD